MSGAQSLKWEGQTKTYYFVDGVMSTDDYVATATMSDAATAATEFVTINVDGNILTTPGWYQDPETEDWYYIVNVRDKDRKLVQGVVFNADGAGVKRAKNIGGKVYVFDDKGVMLDESVTIEADDCDGTAWNGIPCTKLAAGEYYFNNVKNSGHRGEMQTGKITFTTKNDEEVTRYYDPDKGLMKDAIISGYVYDGNGNLYKALDSKYEIYTATVAHKVYTIKSKKVVEDTTNYPDGVSGILVVNGSGKAFENKTSVTVGYTDYEVTKYVAKEK